MRIMAKLAFTLLITSTICLSTTTATADADSLSAIKTAWNANLSSWVGADPCQSWEGVRCDNASHRVISLNLSNKGIVGTIPSEIGNLQYLKILDLSNPRNAKPPLNQISGDLSALGGLTTLQILNLSLNNIQLPQFPSVVLNLTNLTDLRLDNNYITGPIPPELSKLAKLERLYLGNNTLKGPLEVLGNLVNLLELSLWNNDLCSEIPHEFGNLVNLRYLNLHDCNLYGSLPVELGKLKSIQNISLYRNQLTGIIPDTWKALTNLQALTLSNNQLTRSFPQWIQYLPNIINVSLDHNFFYGTFPNLSSSSKLQILDVRCNFFSGTNAPTSSQTIIINTTGNCFNDSDLNSKIKCSQAYFDCPSFQASIANGGCPSCPSVCPSLQTVTDATTCVCRSPITTGATSTLIRKVVGSIVGVGGFLILARFLCWKWKRTHKQPLRDHEVQGVSTLWEAPEGVLRFTLHVLANATHNFESSQEIGQGGFGKVFYGILDDGKKVAVKRASSSCIQSSSVFHNEVILLSRLHHRNLVHLVGFCDDDDVQILVYEYMTNGNLHTLLFKNNSRLTLNWFRRLDIALDVAQGLEYLHSFADPPVIHRDVKPSNILLDENMVAKLSDFGISKVAREFETHFSTRPAGTVGYIDPQYFLREQLTTASDVYSFGVVLLELISGQKSIDNTRLDDHNLVAWVKSKLNTHGLKSIVDPRLGDEYPEQIYQDIVRLAIDCASFNSKDRPSMKEVVNILDACHSAVSPHLLQEVHDTDNWSYKEQSKDTEGGNAGSSTSFSVSFPSFR